MKHQASCYRNIQGKKFTNYCDLVFSDEENEAIKLEAKYSYKSVKIIKHHSGNFYQIFVSNE